MIETVDVEEHVTLDDYASIASLMGAVQELRNEAATLVPALTGRTLWMLNSTAQGGGVAEMLPKLVSLLNEVGLPTRWLVLNTRNDDFFRITKHIHNLIHGTGKPDLTLDDHRVFEEVSRASVAALKEKLRPGDILAVHDPQPLALGAMVASEIDISLLWRCHIGLDHRNAQTQAAWDFIHPYLEKYTHAVFSAPEYIPEYLAGRSSVVHPAIDPFSHKNRYLSPIKTMGILCNAGLARPQSPTLMPDFDLPALRLRPDGSFTPARENGEIGLMFRPIVTQVSRWDKLKGWEPLLQAFIELKQRVSDTTLGERERRRIKLIRLLMVGPDPASVSDDPEGREVLEKLCRRYRELPASLQEDVALLVLPMESRKENALMVNAVQRCSSIVVQNSIEEGFGLTATEAMYKRVPVMGTKACGLRQQIRDSLEGRLVADPNDPAEVGATLLEMMSDPFMRDLYARNAQRRVHHEFLVFKQVQRLLETLVTMLRTEAGG